MYTVRPFQPNDTFSVIKLAHETLPERYFPNIFNSFYESFPEGFFITEQYSKLVGFIVGIQIYSDSAKILMLSVNKSFRKKGIGSMLLKTFFKSMKKINIIKFDLEVRKENQAAVSFYKKHDFKIVDEIKGYYQNGEDALLMRKIL